MNIILLGAPGAGKGTQSAFISKTLGIPTISTGKMLREAGLDKTELGLQAKAIIDKGMLVSDELIIRMVMDRIALPDCENGFILDGVPRNIPQAETLDRLGIPIDKVLEFQVPEEEVILRLSGRRNCPSCQASYHLVFSSPKVEGICDVCGHALEIREDDQPETVRRRLKVYHSATEPLTDFYRGQGKLVELSALGEILEVQQRVLQALEG